jgi:hypothetical protein
MGGLGEAGEKSPKKKSLLANCATLRDEVAEIIQGSRDARRRFRRRLGAGFSTKGPATSAVAEDAKEKTDIGNGNETEAGLISE